MPLPIIRKIADLHRRIVPNAYPSTPSRDWSNRVISGDIKNLFDGNIDTLVEIDNDFNGSTNGNGYNYVTFDFGKPRKLDRIVFTQPTGNNSFLFDLKFDFWIPGADIYSPLTFSDLHANFNHATVGENTIDLTTNSINTGTGYTGTPVSNHEVRYLKIGIQDDGNGGGYFNTYTQNFKFAGLDIYEQFDARDFSVEFNDSVLDLQGWTGPRYSGCKTTGKKINTYTTGDTTYGSNPNLENKTTAIYISNTLVGGRSNPTYANIAHHSYINIEKILIVDLTDDSVRVLDRGTEPFDSFHRFVTTDFPTGGSFSMKLIDESTQANLKDSYKIKMNKGWLLRSFSYDAGHGPLPGVDVDGTFLNTQNHNVNNESVKDAIANPIALFDAVSGSIERAKTQVWGVTDTSNPSVLFDPVAAGYADATSLGCDDGQGGSGNTSGNCDWSPLTGLKGVYGLFEAETVGEGYFSNIEAQSLNTSSLQSQFNFYNYGTTVGATITPTDPQPYISTYKPTSVGELRFRYGVVNKINDEANGTGNFTNFIFQPLYIGNNTELVDNKFTREFVDPSNNQQTKTRSFKLNTIEEIEDLRSDASLLPDFKIWYKQKEWNPSMSASVFIGNCVQHLNQNSNTTELHLTLFQGTKDFSGKNDELSISTFEVDKNLNPNYLNFESSIGPITKTIGPRLRYLKLKNQPQFKPTIPTANYTTQDFSDPGNPVTTLHETGRDRVIFDTIETDQFRAEISEKQNAFVFGPGTTNQSLDSDAGFVQGINTYGATYDNSPANSSNFSGSFSYELSFLDKDHTIIADVDIFTELEDGIGHGGIALIPEHTHEMVKLNIEYYLFKAGMGENEVTKRFINNND